MTSVGIFGAVGRRLRGDRSARPRLTTAGFFWRAVILVSVALVPVLIWFLFDVIGLWPKRRDVFAKLSEIGGIRPGHDKWRHARSVWRRYVWRKPARRPTVGFTPGAASDIIGASWPMFVQEVVVENKPGAGSSIAAEYLTAYIRSRASKEAHMMISRAHQELPIWSMDSSLATVLGLPPKDPDDDDDEDEEDDEDEGEEEPAVVREPDE